MKNTAKETDTYFLMCSVHDPKYCSSSGMIMFKVKNTIHNFMFYDYLFFLQITLITELIMF